jgi:hypothetical protein
MTAQTITNAVAQRDNGAQALITKYRDDFAQVLPGHLRTKRERLDHHLPQLDGLSTDSTVPKEPTRFASTSRPLSADAREGRPTTPDSV